MDQLAAPSAPLKTAVPDATSTTETRLLDLLQQHLAETGRAIEELRGGMDRLSDRFEAASNRLFVLALLLIIVVAATSGANLYVSYRGATVGTGEASSIAAGRLQP